MAEADFMRHLQKLASKLGARLFRQQSGMGWAGNTVIKGPATVRLGAGDIAIRNARPFHAGHEGLSDLGGWVPVTITPEHVGATLAVYTQVEVKFGKGRATDAQKAWINAVNQAGGLADVIRSDEEFIEFLRRVDTILRGEEPKNKQPPLL